MHLFRGRDVCIWLVGMLYFCKWLVGMLSHVCLGIWYLVGGYVVAHVYLGIWYLVGGWMVGKRG